MALCARVDVLDLTLLDRYQVGLRSGFNVTGLPEIPTIPPCPTASGVRFVRFRSSISFANIGLPRDARRHSIDLGFCGVGMVLLSLGGSTEEECRRWPSA